MAKKTSAGVVLYKIESGCLRVLIGHMGGPFWAKKDEGSWSIPKGEYVEGEEDPLEVAQREFEEELGSPLPSEELDHLGEFKQPSGKVITVWAAKGDLDASKAVSNTFELEWPKGSGRIQEFPEIDRAEWFDLTTAKRKVLKGHVSILERLRECLATKGISVEEDCSNVQESDQPNPAQRELFG